MTAVTMQVPKKRKAWEKELAAREAKIDRREHEANGLITGASRSQAEHNLAKYKLEQEIQQVKIQQLAAREEGYKEGFKAGWIDAHKEKL